MIDYKNLSCSKNMFNMPTLLTAFNISFLFSISYLFIYWLFFLLFYRLKYTIIGIIGLSVGRHISRCLVAGDAIFPGTF